MLNNNVGQNPNVVPFPSTTDQPSKKLLDNWSVWIASEIVQQWQESSPKINIDFDKAFQLKEEKLFSDFWYELKAQIESEQETCYSVDEIECSKYEIDSYFSGELAKEINQCLEDSRLRNMELLKKFVSVDCSKVSPKEQTRLLSELCQILKLRKDKFQSQKNIYLQQAESALLARFELIRQFKANTPKGIYSKKYKSALANIWKAVLIEFESRLKAEIYGLCGQITRTFYFQCKNYHDFAERSSEILNCLQKSLKRKCEIEIISLPVFTYLKAVDAPAQKSQIELWIGHSINYWGNSPISWQQIEAKLLKNVEEVAINVCKDFQRRFLEQIS